MNIEDLGLALLYIGVWSTDGVLLGRMARRYYREETLSWRNGKTPYTVVWAFSMIWLVASAFILGQLDQLGDFDDVEFVGLLALVAAFPASHYYYRPR